MRKWEKLKCRDNHIYAKAILAESCKATDRFGNLILIEYKSLLKDNQCDECSIFNALASKIMSDKKQNL